MEACRGFEFLMWADMNASRRWRDRAAGAASPRRSSRSLIMIHGEHIVGRRRLDSHEFVVLFAEKIFKIFDHDLSGELISWSSFVSGTSARWTTPTSSFAFGFEDRNPVTKEWWLQQEEGVDLLTQSIFDVETQAYKTCKVFFDDIIMRNGKVTERDWTKWSATRRGYWTLRHLHESSPSDEAVLDHVDLRCQNKMRRGDGVFETAPPRCRDAMPQSLRAS